MLSIPYYTDAFCEVNNCTNNYSYCYVYSATGEQYCAPSCKLNNGGCGALECVMVDVQCIRDPCPPAVECRQPSEYNGYHFRELGEATLLGPQLVFLLSFRYFGMPFHNSTLPPSSNVFAQP